jgi:hypothetical protein
MKKPYKKNQDFMKQTVFSNVHEGQFNPWKKYYGIIKVGDKSLVAEYTAKFRSEAVAVLEEEARLSGGKLEIVGVFK